MIEKTSFLYEVLLRFGPDGLSGAHAIDMVRIVDTGSGEVIAENEELARPITQAEVSDILGAETAGMIEQIGRLEAEVAELTAQLDATRSEAQPVEEP